MNATEKIFIALFAGLSMLLCSFYPHESYEQENEWIDTTLHVGQEVYVIQPAGVSLRGTPHPAGKVLAHLAFGNKLKISRLLNRQENVVPDTTKGLKLSGYWLEVIHAKQKGYVFSTHVFESFSSTRRKAILLFAYETCDANFRYDDRLKYYGIYRTSGGTVIRKGVPSFYVERSISGIGDGHQFRTTFEALKPAPETAELLFIVGLEQNLSEGQIKEILLTDKQRNIIPGRIKSLPEARLTMQATAGIVKIEQESPQRRQALTGLYDCQRLDWCGDVDGDGRLDLIFAAGDKGVTLTLFLSSLGKGYELAGYADSVFFPLCC